MAGTCNDAVPVERQDRGRETEKAGPARLETLRSARRTSRDQPDWKETTMNTIVCIKQVPAKDAPLAIAGNWINESDIGFEMNEPDSYALEEALQLKEKHGGKVVALSLGPERVKQTIHEALAKG